MDRPLAAAARYGTPVLNPGSLPELTAGLRGGAASLLRVAPVAGAVLNGFSIGYELGGEHWGAAAYKTFDAGVIAAAVKAPGWTRVVAGLAAMGYERLGGSQAIVNGAQITDLAWACTNEMGGSN